MVSFSGKVYPNTKYFYDCEFMSDISRHGKIADLWYVSFFDKVVSFLYKQPINQVMTQ